jgi:hypothetical protein
MPKKRFGAEQIVTLLRLVEMFMARGKSTPEALGLSVSLLPIFPAIIAAPKTWQPMKASSFDLLFC